MASLTKRRLDAICEALNARLAGEINAEFDTDFDLNRDDYEGALNWARHQFARRTKAKEQQTK